MSKATTINGPSNLLAQAIILDRYGPRLTMEQLAEVLCISKHTLYNQVSAGVFNLPTYLDGGRRFADYRDVAAYLDECRARAA